MNPPPPIQDLATLARNICTGESTIQEWVRKGTFPAPKLRGGKRYWRWSEVEKWFEGDDNASSTSNPRENIRDATRRIAQGR